MTKRRGSFSPDGNYLGWLRPWRRWEAPGGAPVSVASSVLVFALSGVAALTVVSIGVVYFARHTATREAIRDSQRLTEVVGTGLIEPALSDSLLAGDAAAVAALDELMRTRVIGQAIVRVKLWSRDGVIVYSDEPRMIGKQYRLGPEELQALDQGTTDADLSDLSRPENVFERPYGKLLEVYFPVHTPNGTPLLFEAYHPYASVADTGREIWKSFIPVLVVGLGVLELAQLPLAWSLARSLRRRQGERELLLTQAIEASERERRVIAGELHDGAVQDLVAQSYRLLAVADQLAAVVPEDAVRPIRETAAQTRSTVQGLRSLLVDLYPPNLRSEGIEPALSDLAAPLRARGIEVAISVPVGVRVPERTERLLYRAAREALRNVLQHARANRVELTLQSDERSTILTVFDDGQGFVPEQRAAHRAAGHLGLDLLESLVQESGGRLVLAPEAGGGTRFTVEVPTA